MRRRGNHWNEIAAELRARPGVWRVVLSDSAPGSASYPCTRLRRLGCEVEYRQRAGRVTLRARFTDYVKRGAPTKETPRRTSGNGQGHMVS